jgi:hypothetical protein
MVRGAPGVEESETAHASGRARQGTRERGEQGRVERNSAEHGGSGLYLVDLLRAGFCAMLQSNSAHGPRRPPHDG